MDIKKTVAVDAMAKGGDFSQNELKIAVGHMKGEQELKNYRPIAIINVTCKMCMMMIKERLNNWVEETNFLGDIQCDFRRIRRTEDNMLERMKECFL